MTTSLIVSATSSAADVDGNAVDELRVVERLQLATGYNDASLPPPQPPPPNSSQEEWSEPRSLGAYEYEFASAEQQQLAVDEEAIVPTSATHNTGGGEGGMRTVRDPVDYTRVHTTHSYTPPPEAERVTLQHPRVEALNTADEEHRLRVGDELELEAAEEDTLRRFGNNQETSAELERPEPANTSKTTSPTPEHSKIAQSLHTTTVRPPTSTLSKPASSMTMKTTSTTTTPSRRAQEPASRGRDYMQCTTTSHAAPAQRSSCSACDHKHSSGAPLKGWLPDASAAEAQVPRCGYSSIPSLIIDSSPSPAGGTSDADANTSDTSIETNAAAAAASATTANEDEPRPAESHSAPSHANGSHTSPIASIKHLRALFFNTTSGDNENTMGDSKCATAGLPGDEPQVRSSSVCDAPNTNAACCINRSPEAPMRAPPAPTAQEDRPVAISIAALEHQQQPLPPGSDSDARTPEPKTLVLPSATLRSYGVKLTPISSMLPRSFSEFCASRNANSWLSGASRKSSGRAAAPESERLREAIVRLEADDFKRLSRRAQALSLVGTLTTSEMKTSRSETSPFAGKERQLEAEIGPQSERTTSTGAGVDADQMDGKKNIAQIQTTGPERLVQVNRSKTMQAPKPGSAGPLVKRRRPQLIQEANWRQLAELLKRRCCLLRQMLQLQDRRAQLIFNIVDHLTGIESADAELDYLESISCSRPVRKSLEKHFVGQCESLLATLVSNARLCSLFARFASLSTRLYGEGCALLTLRDLDSLRALHTRIAHYFAPPGASESPYESIAAQCWPLLAYVTANDVREGLARACGTTVRTLADLCRLYSTESHFVLAVLLLAPDTEKRAENGLQMTIKWACVPLEGTPTATKSPKHGPQMHQNRAAKEESQNTQTTTIRSTTETIIELKPRLPQTEMMLKMSPPQNEKIDQTTNEPLTISIPFSGINAKAEAAAADYFEMRTTYSKLVNTQGVSVSTADFEWVPVQSQTFKSTILPDTGGLNTGSASTSAAAFQLLTNSSKKSETHDATAPPADIERVSLMPPELKSINLQEAALIPPPNQNHSQVQPAHPEVEDTHAATQGGRAVAQEGVRVGNPELRHPLLMLEQQQQQQQERPLCTRTLPLFITLNQYPNDEPEELYSELDRSPDRNSKRQSDLWQPHRHTNGEASGVGATTTIKSIAPTVIAESKGSGERNRGVPRGLMRSVRPPPRASVDGATGAGAAAGASNESEYLPEALYLQLQRIARKHQLTLRYDLPALFEVASTYVETGNPFPPQTVRFA